MKMSLNLAMVTSRRIQMTTTKMTTSPLSRTMTTRSSRTSRREKVTQTPYPLRTRKSENKNRRTINLHRNLLAPQGVAVAGVIDRIAANVHLARSGETVPSRGSRTLRSSSSLRK